MKKIIIMLLLVILVSSFVSAQDTAVECPVDCTCDSQGNVLVCEEKAVTCPVDCTCDSQGNILVCEEKAVTCPVDCTCDSQGNVLVCEEKAVTCPEACACDKNGNIIDCDKTECKDSDNGKKYYIRGNVFVPHTGMTYDDKCAYGQAGNPDTMNNKDLLFEAYCFEDKFGYGYSYYSCPNGCKDGACIPFFEEKEEIEFITEEIESSTECSQKECKTIFQECIGDDKIIIEECTFYIKSNDVCQENQQTHSKIQKGACASAETTSIITFCQGCQLDESTCIPFGTRLEKKGTAYYCDITKEMMNQKEDKKNCQNSYECLSNNCKSGICSPICEGCLNENNICLPISTRTEMQYCDADYSLENQKSEDMSCNNNYECSTNICVNNQCISPSFIQKIIDWFKKLFGE